MANGGWRRSLDWFQGLLSTLKALRFPITLKGALAARSGIGAGEVDDSRRTARSTPKLKIALLAVAGILTVVVPPAILKASGAPFMVVALVACALGGIVGTVVAKRFLDDPAQL